MNIDQFYRKFQVLLFLQGIQLRLCFHLHQDLQLTLVVQEGLDAQVTHLFQLVREILLVPTGITFENVWIEYYVFFKNLPFHL